MSKTVVTLWITLMFCFAYPVGAQETNFWNFEDGVLGVGENKSNSKVETRLVTENTKEGKYSLEIKTISDTSAGIQILITNIIASENYRAGAWIKSDSNSKQSFIRIAWYESADGSGSQIKTVDSQKLSDNSDWTRVEVEYTPPPASKSAKIRVFNASKSDGLESKILVDEIKWEKVTAPPTPTATTTPSPTSTPTILPTPTIIYISPTDIEEIEQSTTEDKDLNNANGINIALESKSHTDGDVLATNSININTPPSITSSEIIVSDNENDRPKNKRIEIKEATDSVKLFTKPWDGWLAIGVGLLAVIISLSSYIWSLKHGEYNRRNEN